MKRDSQWQSEAVSVDVESVRAHVARIVASDLFSGAERMCRFLLFTVESKLGGKENTVKEYAIGREVFDRGGEYDTRLDPIVRVEARRLRARLSEYYAGPGRDEPIRLEYPKGSYVPVISGAPTPVAAAPRNLKRWATAAVGTAVIVTLAAALIPRAMHTRTLAPVPEQWIQSDDGTLEAAAIPLSESVDEKLANASTDPVIAWPHIASANRSLSLQQLAAQLGANELVVIVARHLGGTSRILVFLIDEPAGRKRHAFTYYDAMLRSPQEQSILASRIATDIASYR